ncbi:MAG: hypothetical protein IT427_10830 [Pirellulales bacterium]|nr:hypothetical protein [Pirellulales bacterium]
MLMLIEYHYKLAAGLACDCREYIPRQFAPSDCLTMPEEFAVAAAYGLSDEIRPCSRGVIDLEQYPFLGRNPSKRGE